MDAGMLSLIIVCCVALVQSFRMADARDKVNDLEKRIKEAAERDWQGGIF